MKFRKIISFTGAIITIAFLSCNSDKKNNTNHSLVLEFDNISLQLKYAETLFIIPSPIQTSLLLKNCHAGFRSDLLAPCNNLEKYNTTLKKAIILGVYCANISYLHLYNQKELAIKYLENIKKIVADLELNESIDQRLLDKLMINFDNSDSVTYYISELYKESNTGFKNNDRWDLSAFAIAGGWIESFYYLNWLYDQTKNPQIFEIIVYQEDVLKNLIKITSPFYEKSTEYAEFIDDLINISYEFDVLDKYYKTNNVKTDTISNSTFIDNTARYEFTGSKMQGLFGLVKKVRSKILN